jgi:peptide-methionine (S)-S-oxide reductase
MGTVAGMEAAQLYEEMVRHFFKFHDPTTQDRQGNDAGTQYASVIYCYSPEQEAIAAKVKLELQQLVDSGKVRYTGNAVTTAILPATVFYKADDEHQSYLTKNPGGYCNHAYRFKDWPY